MGSIKFPSLRPKWQLDEMKKLSEEYTNLTEVQAYDVRRHQILNIQEENENRFDGWIDWWNESVGSEMVPHAERHLREKYSTFGWIMEGILTRAGFRIDQADCGDIVAEYLCAKSDRNHKI